MTPFPPCPTLPSAEPSLDWRSMACHGKERGGAFYLSALTYAQTLWRRGLTARAMLCLDRALGADLPGDDPLLRQWPWPYAGMAWFLVHNPKDVFMGNPRVHFQHYADRLRGERQSARKARAWACWALVRTLRPELPGDPKHLVIEPTDSEIEAALLQATGPTEVKEWRRVCREAPQWPRGVGV